GRPGAPGGAAFSPVVQPRLHRATAAQRNRWRLIGRGVGIHWEDLDEDLSVEGVMAL
ncbi:MAG: DUF2442 domain-containing protein, partial [Planctomycetota bacterium]|nr:DUF2442 domain-containing protein [Planctomycetota bacterium]